MNNEKRFNAFAHKFKYRSPLWIESDSDVSKSSQGNGGLGNSDDSIQCQSSDSSGSINNYLDSKVSSYLINSGLKLQFISIGKRFIVVIYLGKKKHKSLVR